MDPFWQTLITSSVPAAAAVATVIVGNVNTRKGMQEQWNAEAAQRQAEAKAAREQFESDQALELEARGRAAEVARLDSVRASLRAVVRSCAAVETHVHHLMDERSDGNWATSVDREAIRELRTSLQELRVIARDDRDLRYRVETVITDVDTATQSLTKGTNWQTDAENAVRSLEIFATYIVDEWEKFM